MAKLPRLQHVKYVRARGHVYAYFNTGKRQAGKVVYAALPKPGSVGFFDSYASFVAGRNRGAKETYTVEALCNDYQNSRKFAEKSAGTQRSYGVYLRLVSKLLGDCPVDELDRASVQYVLDREEFGAGKQNLFVAVIGTAYKWGRGRDKTQAAPVTGIEKAETGERMPWPDDILEAALNAENPRVRLATALLFYTGQRIGDVCAMKWSAIKDGRVAVIQEKTGKELKIALHSQLRAELDRQGKRGISLLVSDIGRPVKQQTIRNDLKAFCASMGRPDLLPHGLRKNAVMALLRAGCSVAETSAITGQTYLLVEYYARQIDQVDMGDSAILKFENRVEHNKNRKT
jgi:integrase